MESIMTPQSTFTSCMHDQMLESNRDDVKLEAMRCVTVMTARGKLSVPRTLFPHIVKNVSSKNPELKKLIYLYLTNFADQEPDLALLPVASLQKNLKSPNPLVRSSAIKVLTSMRLEILSAILIATIRSSINDLSPYVRKTVAHSIIKLYRLDPTLQDELVQYIERMFNDKNSMVMSSAVATFEVVCPNRLDLLQKNYKRLCFLLADCNEWGQAILLNLLKRFIETTHKQIQSGKVEALNLVETDPKTLLRAAKSLIHSNNSAVVMEVVNLFIAIANQNEVRSTIPRPMIRLLSAHREVQLIVLNMIDEMTSIKPNMRYTSEAETSVRTSVTPESSAAPENPDQELNDDDIPTDAIPCQEATPAKDEYIPLDSEAGEAKPDAEDVSKANEGSVHEPESPSSETSGDDDDDEDDESGDDEEESSDDDENDSEDDSDDVASETELSKGSDNLGHASSSQFGNKNVDMTAWNDIDPKSDPNFYREIFRPYIKSFFVKHNECTQIRLAKLKILTNLSSPVNVTLVLRELQAYVTSYAEEEEFVSASIQAIGRCASMVKEVAHICLNGLTSLLSNNNEHVVAEAIVVLRSQIINKQLAATASNSIAEAGPANDLDANKGEPDVTKSAATDDVEDAAENERIISTVIKQVTRLLPKVTAPQARATILWILAEFCERNRTAAKCSPEVLRRMAKSFCTEDNFVKLQCLTLASKFLLTLDKHKAEKQELYKSVSLLASYLFSLAKYDINHDVRDRGRFLRKLLEDERVCRRVVNCAY